jgi:hypothetical protein
LSPSRATKELYGPLGNALLPDVFILARIGLRYILTLSNQSKWWFRSFCALGKCMCLGVGREGIIVVTAVVQVARAGFRVAPNPIF